MTNSSTAGDFETAARPSRQLSLIDLNGPRAPALPVSQPSSIQARKRESPTKDSLKTSPHGPNTEGRCPVGGTRPSARPGRRPVLVLSHDVFNERSGTVIAVGLNGQEPRAGFPLTLESKAAGLTKRSWVKISQIRTLSVDLSVR